MSARFSFGRRSTNTSTSTAASGSSMASSARSFVKGRTMSWRDREQRKRESVLVEDFYLMYELDWSALRDWLQARFPGLDFREEYDSSGDSYKFNIPRKLTEEERGQIYRLRNDQNHDY